MRPLSKRRVNHVKRLWKLYKPPTVIASKTGHSLKMVRYLISIFRLELPNKVEQIMLYDQKRFRELINKL